MNKSINAVTRLALRSPRTRPREFHTDRPPTIRSDQLQKTELPDLMQDLPSLKNVEFPEWIADVPSLKKV
jgi:hypothetical protein